MGSFNGAGVDELRRADLELEMLAMSKFIFDKVFLRMWKLLEDVLLKMVSIRCRQLELVLPIFEKLVLLRRL